MLDLKMVVEKYPHSMATRSQLASLLHDLYPSEKRDVNIALAVYDSGIAARVASLKALDSIQQSNFIKLLMDEYGLQEQYAAEGIALWANAYGLTCSIPAAPYPAQVLSEDRIKHNPDAYAKVPETYNGSSSDFELIETADGVVIEKFRGFEEAKMIVPNMVDGKKVIGIGENAYKSCTNIQSLTIANGIEWIQDGAFANCKSLSTIVLPKSLRSIGTIPGKLFNENGVFTNCPIKHMSLPKHVVYIGSSTFSGCELLGSINLPNSITEIKSQTFQNCSRLKKVILPENLVNIGAKAFLGCSALTDIRFPLGLQKIEYAAFKDCRSLSTIVLNEGLKEIGADAFVNCSSLVKLLMPSTVEKINDSYDVGGGNDIFSLISYHLPYDRRRNGFFLTSKNDKLTIYCHAGSYGLEYARIKGYPIKKAAEFPS